jgi:error-prone DNA polymerase
MFDTMAGMGFDNPPVPWKVMEAVLSGRTRPAPSEGDGGDSPAWSYHRGSYEPPTDLAAGSRRGAVPYAELHCHSNFSFQDGASHPEELVEEAARLGLEALAITDHDGMYGVVRFAEAAGRLGMPTVFGAELSLGLTRVQQGVADPEGSHLLILARDPVGYTRLCRALTVAHLRGGEKGRPAVDLATLAALGRGEAADLAEPGSVRAGRQSTDSDDHPDGSADHWAVFTGCRKGAVPGALVSGGPAAAATELARLQRAFGRDNVVVELWDHGDPLDSARNDALVTIADRAGAALVATNNVHYHRPDRRRLASALAAVRARRSLDDMDGWLPASGAAHLRSGAEQARRFARYPGVVELAAEMGTACAFDLSLVAPRLPPFPTAEGQTEMDLLRRLTEEGGIRRYGPRHSPKHPRAWEQIEHELALIQQLEFPDRLGHRPLLPGARHLLPGAGIGGQLGRLLCPRDHQCRRRHPGPAVRAVPLARTGRPARHRPRHRIGA